MLVSAAVPALLSVPLRLSLRAIPSTRSTQTLASIAVLARLSALSELFPRVEYNFSKIRIIKRAAALRKLFLSAAPFFNSAGKSPASAGC